MCVNLQIHLVDEPEMIEKEVNDAYHAVLQQYLPTQTEQHQPEATA